MTAPPEKTTAADHQPTQAELEEPHTIGATPEELGAAVMNYHRRANRSDAVCKLSRRDRHEVLPNPAAHADRCRCPGAGGAGAGA